MCVKVTSNSFLTDFELLFQSISFEFFSAPKERKKEWKTELGESFEMTGHYSQHNSFNALRGKDRARTR